MEQVIEVGSGGPISCVGLTAVNAKFVRGFTVMSAFIRMASGSDLKRLRWNGDGTGANREIAKQVVGMPGFVQDTNGELHFADGIAGPVRTMS